MFLLYVCLNKDEKSIQVVIFFSFFVLFRFYYVYAWVCPSSFFALGFSV